MLISTNEHLDTLEMSRAFKKRRKLSTKGLFTRKIEAN